MSKVLMNNRTKRLPSMGGVSLHSLTSTPSAGNMRGSAYQQQSAEPVVVELGDDAESENDENGKFLSKPSPIGQGEPKSLDSPTTTVRENPTPPSKLSSFKRFCRRLYKKFGMKHMITLFMMVIYTIIGAAAFLSIEKSADIETLNEKHAKYVAARKDFSLDLGAKILINSTLLTDNEVMADFIDKALEEFDNKRGCEPSTETAWNFWHAMYFAGTIYTTIGYGDIACRTVTGRVITMIYSLVGIPLMLITLTDLGGLLMKFMFGISQCWSKCKHRFSPSNLFGPHPPGYDDKPIPISKYKTVLTETALKDKDENRSLETMEKGKPDEDDDVDDLYELERREDEDYEYQLMRIPVLTALLTTIGYIFLCAGLFCIWEDWSYFTSVYFFFISLSTIGLGDETPEHKDIMVATYFFVIVGLSLVSMCITVIQRRLEDLYLHLLQMILIEYQRKLRESGGDQTGATVGMMQAWQKSKTARYLMPLLSKDKKKNVAKQFQDEAKAQGIILPVVLRDLDFKTGMPAVLSVSPNRDNEGNAQTRDAVGDAIQRATAKARSLNEPVDDDLLFQPIFGVESENKNKAKAAIPIPVAPPVVPILYDADTQTDELEVEDKQEQTVATPHADAQTQSHDTSFASNLRVDETSQTPILEYDDVAVQCLVEETKPEKPPDQEEETQTEMADSTEASSQTSKISNKEQQNQTHLYDLSTIETQTDQVQTKNQRLQTPVPEILEHEAQTDPLILDPEQFQATGTLSMKSDQGNKKGWAKAKKNLSQAIKKAKTGMQPSTSKAKMPSGGVKTVASVAGIEPTPAMATWNDVVGEPEDDKGGFSVTFTRGEDEDEEEEEEDEDEETEEEEAKRASVESLNWDPIDGLHAEPKRKVGDLKKMFEPKHHHRSVQKRPSVRSKYY